MTSNALFKITPSSDYQFSDNVRYYEATGYPLIDDLLKDRYGCFVYQEDIMKVFASVTNIKFGEADVIRRIVAKGKKKDLPKVEKQWYEGCKKNGIDEKTAEIVWKELGNAKYKFNASHGYEYSLHTITTAYLKYHYPVEFAVVRMNIKSEEVDYWIQWLKKNHDVDVISPNINTSHPTEFVLSDDKKKVYSPLTIVKGLADKLAYKIIENRPYTSDEDLDKIPRFSKRIKMYLALVNALDFVSDKTAYLKKLGYHITNGNVIETKKNKVIFCYQRQTQLEYEVYNKKIIYTFELISKIEALQGQGYQVGLITKAKQGKTKKNKLRYEYHCNDDKFATFYSFNNTIIEGDLIYYKLNGFRYIEEWGYV